MTTIRRTAREVQAILRAASPTHSHLRDRLYAMFVITVTVDAIATIAIFFTEHTAKGSEIKTFGSAAFWVTCQLLTVSSQLKNPITPAARVIDVFLELYAITIVASLAGVFGSFFNRRSIERAGLPTQASSD